MRTEWVVLADDNRARIFVRSGGTGWQSIQDMTRAHSGANDNGREVRLPAGLQKLDAMAGRIGRTRDAFIDRLAHVLCNARKRGDFDALVLIAPTDFLEPLKAALDAATRRKLIATATDDLVSLPLPEARRQISRRF